MVSSEDMDDRCPDCGSLKIVIDSSTGEKICGECGLVTKEKQLDTGPEWRAFNIEERNARRRAGQPMSLTFYDKGLSTTISHIGRDAKGRKLSRGRRIQMRRLRKWHIRSKIHSSVNRNLSRAMTDLSYLADRLHLPLHIKEKAALLYRKALDHDLVRGRSIAAIVAASVYAACRATKTPRTLREVAEHSTIDLKEIARSYRLMVRRLDLSMPIPAISKRIPKIADKINVDEKTKREAVEIIKRARELKVTAGKDPMGLAAAALYISCRMNEEDCTQKMIASAAGVTEVTIRNRYKGLKRELGLEV